MRCRNQDRVWTKKDGTRVKLRNMSNDHLVNTIRYLANGPLYPYTLEWLRNLSIEGKRRQVRFDEPPIILHRNQVINKMLKDTHAAEFYYPRYSMDDIDYDPYVEQEIL